MASGESRGPGVQSPDPDHLAKEAVNAVSELPMAHNSYDELSVIGNGEFYIAAP